MAPQKKPGGRGGKSGGRKPAGQHRGSSSDRSRAKVSPRARRRAHAFVAATPGTGGSAAQPAEGVRLNRWLAERGVASRRKADELIQAGSVSVNGEILAEPGYRVQSGDEIRVSGQRVKDVPRLYYVFYKPRGVLCTDSPRERRKRVRDLVDPLVPARVYPIGRLDEDSEGLLLLTNDGDFANFVAHPRYGVPKTYVARVSGTLGAEAIARLRKGVHLSEGKVVPSRVKVVARGKQTSTVEIVLREGRNRELRRMLARVGHSVKSLKRVRIGSLGLRGLPRGGLRPLTLAERDSLLAHARGEGAEVREADRRAGKSRPQRARRTQPARKRD